MTTERLLELNMLTMAFDSIITPSAIDKNGEFVFEGRTYDAKAMVTRQDELLKEFLAPYEVSSDAYVIEETEESD